MAQIFALIFSGIKIAIHNGNGIKFAQTRLVESLKKVFKVLRLILASAVVLVAAMSLLIYVYRDQVIRMAVNRINAYLDTPVEVRDIKLDILESFPGLTLEFNQVKIAESTKITGNPLCEAGRISISFSIYDLLAGNHNLQAVTFENTEIHLGIDGQGRINYRILKTKSGSSETSGKSDEILNVGKLTFKNVRFRYSGLKNNQFISLHSPGLIARMRYRRQSVTADLEGIVHSDSILVREINYLAGEVTRLKSDFTFDRDNDELKFNRSSLVINGYEYRINGTVGTANSLAVDLSVESTNSDIKALTSLLPLKYRNYLNDYQSEGAIQFHGTVEGSLSSGKSLRVDFEFGCREMSLYHLKYKKSFRNISLDGKFTNGQAGNFQTSHLEIRNLKGDLEGRQFSGELRLHDFNRMNIELDISAGLDLASILVIFPIKDIRSGGGDLTINLKASGDMKNPEGRWSGAGMSTSGDVSFRNVDLLTYYTESSLVGLNGLFYFNNADLAIAELNGQIGSSDFRIKGFFKNIVPFILVKGQPILIEADFASDYMDLNELLKFRFTRDASAQGYHLDISPRLDIRLNTKLRKVSLQKFSASGIEGKVYIMGQRVMVEEARMHTMGGILTLSGSFSATHPVDRQVLADGHFDGIHIDSIFYVFNNFRQDFLVYRHLQGKINADINTFLILDNELRFKPESLLSFIDISIIDGELINFEPMQSLSRYIDSEALKHLKFSELRNDIQVRNKTITIPEMEIISNVSTIRVSGTHTFDQHIDYHFMVPLSQFSQSDPDARFGEIAEDETGKMNIFLKMTGTTRDYKVIYDTRAVTRKILQDFKKEGKEIKNLFQKQDSPQKNKVELDEDEYF